MIAGAMSQMAESPIPGGRSFRDVTGDIVLQKNRNL
jgi:hypothetical protein